MNTPQRPARPSGLRRTAFRIPILLYRARLGGLLGHRFVLIHHTGRRTGLPRQVVVEVVTREPESGAVVVASGFGPASDWYRNLLNTPDAEIELGWRRIPVHAEPMSGQAAGRTMESYARDHPRAARGLARFMGYGIDGGDADYLAMGDTLPMLRLVPREAQSPKRAAP
jgi:deazaflavin-dependent oxidoreductase (nitroreductase family)